MAEVTRVPLQPVSRNSLIMLFLGIVIGLAIAGAVAWFMAPKGLSVEEVVAGTGENPKPTDVVFVRYTGKLEDGTVFDQTQDAPWPIPGIMPEGAPLPLERMIPGFREAAVQMQRGGKYEVWIPAAKAYGEIGQTNPQTGEQVVPPNANLSFEIELIDFMPMAEAESRFEQLQMAMMKRQQPGAQGGAAPAPATAPTQ